MKLYVCLILVLFMRCLHCFDCCFADLPLCDETKARLQRNNNQLIEILHTSLDVLDYLLKEHAIDETDYHNLLGESEMSRRNAMLIDIFTERGTERGFECFCNYLSSDENQKHVVSCLLRGITLLLK